MTVQGKITLIAVVGLITSAVLFRQCSRRSQSAPSSASSSKLSDTEKKRVLAFWAAFRAAEELRREGQWQKALPEYREALKLDPGHEGALYYMASSYLELNRFSEALVPLRKLVKVNPLSQNGYLQIGLIHSCPAAQAIFDLDAAEKAYRRAMEINQEESGSLLRLAGVTLVKGSDEQAFKYFELANRSNFRAIEGYYLRAYVRWKQGKLEAARDLLREAHEQSKKPVVVAGVAGEGDTRPGAKLPPTTMQTKQLIRSYWQGLLDRFPKGGIETVDLDAEFEKLHASLERLKAR